MAYTTEEVLIGPADGWAEIADSPVHLRIKPHGTARAWFIAVTDGTPPVNGTVGFPMGRGRAGDDNTFEIDDLTGKVFVRVNDKPDAVSEMMFTVIKDVA